MKLGLLLILGICILLLLSRMGYERNNPVNDGEPFQRSMRGYQWNLVINNPVIWGGELCKDTNKSDCDGANPPACCVPTASRNLFKYRVGIFAVGEPNAEVPTTAPETEDPVRLWRSDQYDTPNQNADKWNGTSDDNRAPNPEVLLSKGWLRVVIYPQLDGRRLALDSDAPGMLFADINGKLVSAETAKLRGEPASNNEALGIVILQKKVPGSGSNVFKVSNDFATFMIRPR